MRYLLDSNAIIAALMGTSDPLRARMAACDEGDLVTSAIAFGEVAFGSMHGRPPLMERLDLFVGEVRVLPFDAAAATAYATLPFRRASYDRLIAGHALSLGLTLVTDDERHFADIPDLRVENWLMTPEPGA